MANAYCLKDEYLVPCVLVCRAESTNRGDREQLYTNKLSAAPHSLVQILTVPSILGLAPNDQQSTRAYEDSRTTGVEYGSRKTSASPRPPSVSRTHHLPWHIDSAVYYSRFRAMVLVQYGVKLIWSNRCGALVIEPRTYYSHGSRRGVPCNNPNYLISYSVSNNIPSLYWPKISLIELCFSVSPHPTAML